MFSLWMAGTINTKLLLPNLSAHCHGMKQLLCDTKIIHYLTMNAKDPSIHSHVTYWNTHCISFIIRQSWKTTTTTNIQILSVKVPVLAYAGPNYWSSPQSQQQPVTRIVGLKLVVLYLQYVCYQFSKWSIQPFKPHETETAAVRTCAKFQIASSIYQTVKIDKFDITVVPVEEECWARMLGIDTLILSNP